MHRFASDCDSAKCCDGAGAGAGRGGGVGADRGCSKRAPAGPVDCGALIIPLGWRCGPAVRVGGIWVVTSVCRGGGAGAAWVLVGAMGIGGGVTSLRPGPPVGIGAADPCGAASRSDSSSAVCTASPEEWKSRS